MESCKQLEEDISEINELLNSSTIKSARIRKVLSEEKDRITLQLKSLPAPKQTDLPAQDVTTQQSDVNSQFKEGKQIQMHESASSMNQIKDTKFTPISSYSWDQDGYNGKNVFVYVSLKNVGTVKDNVFCDFSKDGFDLKVIGLDGKNYRLLKNELYKEIVPENSKFRVKADRVVITLRKTEGKYGTDHWTDLVEKNKAIKSVGKKGSDPTAGIMDLMKQMYDEGDDQMRKTIGEAMLKSRQRGPGMDSMDMDM